MIAEKKEGCCSPKTLIFTPIITFVFAAMSYYYFQYNYSRFAKVDFNEWILYTQDSLFLPLQNRYKMIFYSSNIEEQLQYIHSLKGDSKEGVLALDFHQNRSFVSDEHKIYVTSGINTILLYAFHFKVSRLPAEIIVERKQDKFFQVSALRQISSGEIKLAIHESQNNYDK